MIEDKTYLNVLTLESVKYKFGQELPYLWSDVKNFYTNKISDIYIHLMVVIIKKQ